jgi:hypothetical protein
MGKIFSFAGAKGVLRTLLYSRFMILFWESWWGSGQGWLQHLLRCEHERMAEGGEPKRGRE